MGALAKGCRVSLSQTPCSPGQAVRKDTGSNCPAQDSRALCSRPWYIRILWLSLRVVFLAAYVATGAGGFLAAFVGRAAPGTQMQFGKPSPKQRGRTCLNVQKGGKGQKRREQKNGEENKKGLSPDGYMYGYKGPKNWAADYSWKQQASWEEQISCDPTTQSKKRTRDRRKVHFLHAATEYRSKTRTLKADQASWKHLGDSKLVGGCGLWRCNTMQVKETLAKAGYTNTDGWTKLQMINQLRTLKFDAWASWADHKFEGPPPTQRQRNREPLRDVTRSGRGKGGRGSKEEVEVDRVTAFYNSGNIFATALRRANLTRTTVTTTTTTITAK
eukprot:TRINITY_DN45403_c0_g1_i1.p1 TRINITY_DN45403_c0_g1~~TRINITY_DN45403_c0_g1_i1.p1  ORF type:complete len:330 (+),score=27.10 TRINITY_DN45403_c0_g1_i1:78-1067(+)